MHHGTLIFVRRRPHRSSIGVRLLEDQIYRPLGRREDRRSGFLAYLWPLKEVRIEAREGHRIGRFNGAPPPHSRLARSHATILAELEGRVSSLARRSRPFCQSPSWTAVIVSQAIVSTSTIGSTKACGASRGRSCPTPPEMVRWSYLPVNFAAYALGGACGAPFSSPSSVIVGTAMSAVRASFRSNSSYLLSPSAKPRRYRL